MIEDSMHQARRLRESLSNTYLGAGVAALLVLALLLPVWYRASRWYETQLIAERRSEMTETLSVTGNALSAGIIRRLARLEGLFAFVEAQLQSGQVPAAGESWPEFDTFTSALYATSSGIRNLSVAPEGVVRYVYPRAGNEDVLGYAPLQDTRPEIREDVQRAIQAGETTLSGPIDLMLGGTGLVARRAVLQEGEFWGLVNIVLDLPTVLDEAGIGGDDEDLQLALRDHYGRVFLGTPDVFSRDPVITRVELPEEVWELAGVPSEGWAATIQQPLMVFEAAGLIILLLLASLAFLSINRQSQLRAAVRRRTLELEQDISKRELIEAALREREAQYRAIFESTSDGLFINDLNGHLVDFNPAAAHIHGYSPGEFRLLQPHQFIHPDSLSVFGAYLDAVKRGDLFRGRATDVRKDGTTFPVEVLGTGFTYRGQPHALAVVRDITEEVETVQELEEKEALRTQELTTLLVLSNRLVSTLEMAPLVELILDQLRRVVDYTGATVLILEGQDLQAVGHRGPVAQDAVRQLRVPLETVKGFWTAMSRREPLIVDDVQAETAQAEIYRQITKLFPEEATGYVRAWMGVPLMVQERLIGALSINQDRPQAYTYRHITLAMAIANQAAIAIENARLYEQAQMLAVLEERQRLARELHDSVSQALYGIGMGANTARELLERDPAQAVAPLDYVISLTDAGLAEMRALIFELRPDSLEKEGLVAALRKQAAALSARHRLDVETEFCEEPTLPFETKEALYRIAQEALNNTVKHARATAVALSLDNCGGEITLEVQDNGLGFDTQREYPGHLGLKTMQERVAKLGGTLEIESEPSRGTLLRASIPP
jgi:PAS domain S-box-containing protein